MFGTLMFVYCMLSINLAFLYRYVCIAHKRVHRFFVAKKTQILLHLATIGTCICALIYPISQRSGRDVRTLLPITIGAYSRKYIYGWRL